jgi:hypothetical protein
LFAREQSELRADTWAAHGRQCAVADRGASELERVRLDLEAQPARIAREAQEPGRVIDEAPLVEDA